MKKVLFSALFTVLSFTAYTAIECNWIGAGSVHTHNVTFNDPDGDCISDDCVDVQVMTDGSWEIVTNAAYSDPIDFGTWGCCDPA